jgi:hypothetical protein
VGFMLDEMALGQVLPCQHNSTNGTFISSFSLPFIIDTTYILKTVIVVKYDT